MAHFDPINVPLQENNIVEASAGTGKTFSIGLLVLRLLIEKKLPIKKILMVTFTNAAVAELASRIRSFLAKAIKAAEGAEIGEDDIMTIVEKYKTDDTIELLKKALTELDEASIQTIHSFCQEALNNYALDADQTFGLELKTDINEIILNSIRHFWRSEIAVLPVEVLENLTEVNFDILKGAVDESFKGKIYATPEDEKISTKELQSKLKNLKEKYIKNRSEIKSHLQDVASKKIYIKGFNKNWGPSLLTHAESFSGYLELLNTDKAYKINICEMFYSEERELCLKLFSEKSSLLNYLITSCTQEVREKVRNQLKDNHLLTYDDLIQKMHQAVVQNKDFRKIQRNKFTAIFIDEFQDTDKLQYEIYNQLFGKNKILFYIGDPKQSIYAWRKADLHTYFEAKSHIPGERHYEMDKNYRSSPAYIEAIGEFYSRCEDPFSTAKSGLDLRYLPVKAHNQSTGLKKETDVLKALQVFDGETKGKIKNKIPKLVHEILHGGYLLNGKEVINADIGILVRTNNEAAQVKGLLAGAGIHAITIDDNQVFRDSQEAKSLRYILQAVLDTSESNINKAILNSFTGFDAKKVAEIKKDDLLDTFRVYREIWFRSGVYPMLKEYMDNFGVMRHLLETSNANGLRILTDLTQMLELLQKAEYRQELRPLGLYEYFGKQIAGELQEEDEYQQRMESDEAAVKIVTVHKSKGLEYPIVIAPFLDLKTDENNFIKTYAYREEGAEGKYKFYCKGLSNDEQKQLAKEQWEQENRRLLYVALTRAKYNCFLFKTSGQYAGTTCLTPFTAEFDFHSCLEEPLPVRDASGPEKQSKLPDYWGVINKPEKFYLTDKFYGKLSFSGISVPGTYTPKENSREITDEYDQFIFKDIPKGATLGDMLHKVFENIDFGGSPEHHKEELEKLLDKYYPHKKEELLKGFAPMIDHVLDSNISIGEEQFTLRKIANTSKKNEMEFDLRTNWVDLVGLNAFQAGEGIEIGCNTQHMAKSGLLNGFIDLFFTHNKKYYILDWKSNYLGDDRSHYDGEDMMREAMNEGNYHLQYLIYTVAVKKYLEQRLENFDYDTHFGGVIYMFLRGNRAGESTGIYTNKPSLEQVQHLERLFYKSEPAA